MVDYNVLNLDELLRKARVGKIELASSIYVLYGLAVCKTKHGWEIYKNGVLRTGIKSNKKFIEHVQNKYSLI